MLSFFNRNNYLGAPRYGKLSLALQQKLYLKRSCATREFHGLMLCRVYIPGGFFFAELADIS